MRIQIGEITILDEDRENEGAPALSHCMIDIGEEGSEGFDIFFANVANLERSKKNFGHEELGIQNSFLIVERIDEKSIKKTVEKEFSNKEFSGFEEFVDCARETLRWERRENYED